MSSELYLLVGVIVGAAGTFVLLKNRGNNLKSATEHLIMLSKEALAGDKKQISVDLEGKKDAIKTLVDEIRLQLKETDRSLRKSEEDRISNFSELKKELETHKQLASELRGSTDQLKNILSNNLSFERFQWFNSRRH